MNITFEQWKARCAKILNVEPETFGENTRQFYDARLSPRTFVGRLRKAMTQNALAKVALEKDDTRVLIRKNRTNGVYVALDFCPGEPKEARWNTTCLAHSLCMGHSSRRLAEDFLAVPWEWCVGCELEQRGESYDPDAEDGV